MRGNHSPEAQVIEDHTAVAIEEIEYATETVAFIRYMREIGATRHNPEWAQELQRKWEERIKRTEKRLVCLRDERGKYPGGRR